jgi:peptidoglycan-N-acetylglucosamine deacetylase
VSASFAWPNGARVALSMTFDDARRSQVHRALPILDAHGVHGTFFVSFGAFETEIDAWHRAVARGHEIGNHTVTHPCSANFWFIRTNALENYTLAQMEGELLEANDRIEQLVGVHPRTFAYPCGQKYVGRGADTQSYVPLVAKHFLAGRGFRDESPNNPMQCDPAQLCGIDSDRKTFDQLRQWIEQAAAYAGWVVFASHEVGAPAHQTLDADVLEQLCRYAANPANGVWCDTVAAVESYRSAAINALLPLA